MQPPVEHTVNPSNSILYFSFCFNHLQITLLTHVVWPDHMCATYKADALKEFYTDRTLYLYVQEENNNNKETNSSSSRTALVWNQ